MQIIGRQRIDKAYKKHAEWRASLRSWIRVAEENLWSNFVEVKHSWPSADYVAGRVIFDIANNRARIETLVDYEEEQVIVIEVMTHAEYSRKGYER